MIKEEKTKIICFKVRKSLAERFEKICRERGKTNLNFDS